jgi:hypothetical protein
MGGITACGRRKRMQEQAALKGITERNQLLDEGEVFAGLRFSPRGTPCREWL